MAGMRDPSLRIKQVVGRQVVGPTDIRERQGRSDRKRNRGADRLVLRWPEIRRAKDVRDEQRGGGASPTIGAPRDYPSSSHGFGAEAHGFDRHDR